MIDVNHPGYAAAMGLAGSGFTSRPTAPPLDVESILRNDQLLQGQYRQIGYGLTDAAGNLQPFTYGALGGALAPIDERYRADLIRYGGVPTSVQTDATTRQLAEDATRAGWSTLAQLQHGYRTNQANLTTSAVGRLGHSGAVGQHMLESLRNYDINRADAQANLMSTLAGYQQQKGSAIQQAQAQAQTAFGNAFDRFTEQVRTGQIANPAGLGIGQLQPSLKPYVPSGLRPFTPVSRTMPTYGQPGSQFGTAPGRGRVPLGPTGRPAAAPHPSGYGTPGMRALR